jgi:hypothetical protein
MEICTQTQTTFTEVGACKKRPKIGKYKVKKSNKEKLNIYLKQLNKL